MSLYFVFVRPYKEENQQTTTVLDELILFVVILFFVYIYMKQDEMPIEEKKNLGWIVIFIMIFSILKNMFVLLYFGFINMRKKMKAMFSAEDEALDSPHTSDDNSDTIDSIPTEEIEEEVRKEEYEKEEFNERIRARQQERAFKAPPPMMMMMQQPMMMPPGMMMMGMPPGMMMQGGPPQPNIQQPDFNQQQMEMLSQNAPLPSVQPKKKKANNFFNDTPNAAGVSADAHLNELEQVANDAQAAANNEYGDYYGEGYGEYGYEGYGAEGAEGYGAEGYGQENDAPQPEKNNWGEQEQQVKAPEVSKVEAFRTDSMKSVPKAPSKVEVVPETEEIPEI